MTGIERLRGMADTLRKNIGDMWLNDSSGPLWLTIINIADQIEREQDAMVADSLYDALPPDERDAIAWVREHGGIAKVKEEWNHSRNLKRSLETAQAKVERQQRHIMFVQTKCRERQERICELNKLKRAYVDALNGVCKRLGLTDGTGTPDMTETIWTELDRRLMPEGMEWLVDAWPRFEDDVPLKFGDMALIDGEADMVEAVQLWIHGRPVIYGDNGSQQLERGERVKRPAKVLDADGAEVELGDDLYSVEGGLRLHVGCIDTRNGRIATAEMYALDKWADPAMYTHRAPVLAADGKPLREGETVWGTGREQHEYVVLGQPGLGGGTGRFKVACHDVTDDIDCDCDPSQLIHERPVADSWERLEEDAEKHVCTYFCHSSSPQPPGCGHDVRSCRVDMAKDLVRRAKKLAERGQ